MVVPGPVRDWLHDFLSTFNSAERTYSDVITVLEFFQGSLKPGAIVPGELLVGGTLPTKTGKYSIEITLTSKYPFKSPTITLQPPQGALVSSYPGLIDHNGKCLFSWTPLTSTLLEALGEIQHRLRGVIPVSTPGYRSQLSTGLDPHVHNATPYRSQPDRPFLPSKPIELQPHPVHLPALTQPEPVVNPHGANQRLEGPLSTGTPSRTYLRGQVQHTAPQPQHPRPAPDIMSADTASAVSSAPPLPPGPMHEDAIRLAKEAYNAVRSKLVNDETQVDLEYLQNTFEYLNHMEQMLNAEKQKLETNIPIAKLNIASLQQCIAKAKELSADALTDAPPDAMSIVSTQDRERLEVWATDKSISDTIQMLSRALDREAVTFEVFIKHVRSLARQQFIARHKLNQLPVLALPPKS